MSWSEGMRMTRDDVLTAVRIRSSWGSARRGWARLGGGLLVGEDRRGGAALGANVWQSRAAVAVLCTTGAKGMAPWRRVAGQRDRRGGKVACGRPRGMHMCRVLAFFLSWRRGKATGGAEGAVPWWRRC